MQEMVELPSKKSRFPQITDVRRSEHRWNGRKTQRVDCLSNVSGFNRLDRGKTVEKGKNRGLLHCTEDESIVKNTLNCKKHT